MSPSPLRRVSTRGRSFGSGAGSGYATWAVKGESERERADSSQTSRMASRATRSICLASSAMRAAMRRTRAGSMRSGWREDQGLEA
jgi:hypothetical protein